MSTKKKLRAVAEKLQNMRDNGVSGEKIREYRNKELNRIIGQRKADMRAAILSVEKGIEDIRQDHRNKTLPYDSDPEAMQRYNRLKTAWTAAPNIRLRELNLKDIEEPEYLLILAETMRKRGMSDEADMAYYLWESKMTAWEREPLTVSLRQLKTRLEVLENDPAYVGDDPGNVTKEDYVQVLEDGDEVSPPTMRFKDDNGDVVTI